MERIPSTSLAVFTRLPASSCVFIVSYFVSRSAYETQMSRMEAELIRREAPPSYGQLIAQGLIPNLDDYPAYNQTQVLQNFPSYIFKCP